MSKLCFLRYIFLFVFSVSPFGIRGIYHQLFVIDLGVFLLLFFFLILFFLSRDEYIFASFFFFF